jgi:DNA-binding MarR family transcriptional regulator
VEGMADSIQELEKVFKDLFRKMVSEWNKNVEDSLSGSQAFILELLSSAGKQRVSELALAMNVTAGAVTTLSDKLIAAGYARRQKEEADRRVVYLLITPAGSQILKEVKRKRKATIEAFYQGLPEEDIEHLIRIYTKVLHNLD